MSVAVRTTVESSIWNEPEHAEWVIRRWARDGDALSGCQGVLGVLDRIRRDPDRVLALLIAYAQTGCEVADYLLVRTMAPKLRSMARRDSTADFHDYLAHFWIRVHSYPLGRRPRRIAANLALDTLKAVVAERRPEQESAAWREFRDAIGPADGDLSARDVIEAAARAGLIDGPTAAVLVSVYCLGLTSQQAADHHDTTPELIRYRCSKYVRRMASHRDQILLWLRPSLAAEGLTDVVA